jgi:hypothetical protein
MQPGQAAVDHSKLAPDDFTTSAHRLTSLLTKRP